MPSVSKGVEPGQFHVSQYRWSPAILLKVLSFRSFSRVMRKWEVKVPFFGAIKVSDMAFDAKKDSISHAFDAL